jgi:hypothetical protein
MYNKIYFPEPSDIVENLINFSEEGKDFVKNLLKKNSGNRMEMKDILNHPWFKCS